MGLSPRVTDTPSLLITEVSLTLCICHRLPQGATLILTHPRYRSLLLGGLGAVGVNLARYFNADTRNVPYGLFIQLYFCLHFYYCRSFQPKTLLKHKKPLSRIHGKEANNLRVR